jgi:hypothetical protein
MLACTSALASAPLALAHDPPAEVPDVALWAPQPVATGPAYGVARSSGTPELWATVNICDTARDPDSMGIRASMPGNGTDQRMWMRFRAEYWSRARQAWTAVSGSGTSPWVYAGPADLSRRQAGWTFAFSAPPDGVTFTMRAQVEFEWRARPAGKVRRARRRERRKVVRSVVRTTETGIRGVQGGDPAGTSKAACLIY